MSPAIVVASQHDCTAEAGRRLAGSLRREAVARCAEALQSAGRRRDRP